MSLERRGYEPKLEGHGAHISENKLSFGGFQPNTACFLLQKGTIERHFWNTLFCPKLTHKIEWLGISLWEAILYLARFLGQGCSSDPVITQATGLLIGMWRDYSDEMDTSIGSVYWTQNDSRMKSTALFVFLYVLILAQEPSVNLLRSNESSKKGQKVGIQQL